MEEVEQLGHVHVQQERELSYRQQVEQLQQECNQHHDRAMAIEKHLEMTAKQRDALQQQLFALQQQVRLAFEQFEMRTRMIVEVESYRSAQKEQLLRNENRNSEQELNLLARNRDALHQQLLLHSSTCKTIM